MKIGWLVNDCLTCFPGTETLWHDLLKWCPNLIDMTNGYTPFKNLANIIEQKAKTKGEPDYIIRNASFFRKLNLKCKTISQLHDAYKSDSSKNFLRQRNVCNNSDVTVCVSPLTKLLYKDKIKGRIEVIPIGTDFDFFRPLDNKDELRSKWGIPKDSILYVGSTAPVKGFEKILDLIKTTNYNFCLFMKGRFSGLSQNRKVKVFSEMDKRSLLEIFNCCAMLICTSTIKETLHLAGIEAAACGLPVVTTKVGVYYDMESGPWGKIVEDSSFVKEIENVFNNLDSFKPRACFLQKGLDKQSCRNRWINLVQEIL